MSGWTPEGVMPSEMWPMEVDEAGDDEAAVELDDAPCFVGTDVGGDAGDSTGQNTHVQGAAKPRSRVEDLTAAEEKIV